MHHISPMSLALKKFGSIECGEFFWRPNGMGIAVGIIYPAVGGFPAAQGFLCIDTKGDLRIHLFGPKVPHEDGVTMGKFKSSLSWKYGPESVSTIQGKPGYSGFVALTRDGPAICAKFDDGNGYDAEVLICLRDWTVLLDCSVATLKYIRNWTLFGIFDNQHEAAEPTVIFRNADPDLP